MPRYLFNYCELLSVLGHGTPENPGGDFDMYCWIDAPNREMALDWGFFLLGDYFKHRFSSTDQASDFQGYPVREGCIVDDHGLIDRIEREYEIPSCVINSIPEWKAPWRISNLDRKEVH